MSATTRRRTVLVTVCTVLFLTMLDITIVSVALPALQKDLHPDVPGLQWVVATYVLAFASLLLSGGTLGDRYGRRRLLVGGVVVFVGGSVMSALAPSLGWLLAGRVLQGVGAAASEPGTLSILRQAYPDERLRAHAIGAWAAVSGLALALGPVIGGLLVDAVGWRGVFWFNVPLGAACVLAALAFVEESSDPQGRRVDWPGQVLGAVALGSLTYALIEAQDSGWTSAPILLTLTLAAFAAVGFVAAESRSASPALPLGFFKDRTFAAANFVAFAVNFGIFAVFVFLSLFLQLVVSDSGTGTALHFVPMTAAMVLAAPLSGRWVARAGPRVPMAAGLGLAAVGMLLIDLVLRPDVSFATLGWVLPVAGAGFGLVLSPMTAAVLSTVPRERSGMAAAATNASRQVGAVVGVAVLGAIVNAGLVSSLRAELARMHVPPFLHEYVVNAVTHGVSASQQQRHGVFGSLVRPIVTAAKHAFLDGLHAALLTSAVVLFVSAVLSLAVVSVRRPRAVSVTRRKAAVPVAATED